MLALLVGPALGRLDRLPAWRLLALAGLLLLASNYFVLDDDLHGDVTVPSTVDFLACGAYPLAAIAVLVIAMRGSSLDLWARLLDSLIVLAALQLVRPGRCWSCPLQAPCPRRWCVPTPSPMRSATRSSSSSSAGCSRPNRAARPPPYGCC